MYRTLVILMTGLLLTPRFQITDITKDAEHERQAMQSVMKLLQRTEHKREILLRVNLDLAIRSR